jgi:hypothetical protein
MGFYPTTKFGGSMLVRLSIVVFTIVSISLVLSAQEASTHPKRDAQAVEILTRTVNAAGGHQVLAAVHDMTESGKITFYWGKDVKGPVTIRALGGNHFRMEADLPEGKSTWIVKDGVGSKKDGDKTKPISRENAINLGNLTYPIGHVTAALADSATEVSFIGIEKREGRSVYRLRVKGKLGLAGDGSPVSVVKDLIVDALTFDVLSVDDRPFQTYKPGGRPSDTAPREIDFADFRTVNGVQIPFSISTKLQGQQALSIHLDEVTFNNNLSVGDFQVQK